MRKKIVFFLPFAAVALAIVGFFAYRIIPGPTCFDEKQNQGEEGVDCGGSCAACLPAKPDDLVILWSRFFEVRPGVYDASAFIENPNIIVGASSAPYVFELFDVNGERIVRKSGTAYVLPNERLLIFEGSIATGIRVPKRLAFRFDRFEWRHVEEQSLPLLVARTSREFTQERPRLVIQIANSSRADIRDVDVAAIVTDEVGNALGVGTSRVAVVPDSGSSEAVFTWPRPFGSSVADVQIFIRKNPWAL